MHREDPDAVKEGVNPVQRRTLARSLVRLVSVVALVALGAWPAAAGTRIPLPDGSQPEGLTLTRDGTFYTGSLADGTIFVGNLETGNVEVFAPGATGRSAVGVEEHDGLLWVAGGETGKAWVYRSNGDLIRTYDLDPGGFVNDVVVTRNAAFFTDSLAPFLYRVPLGDGGAPGGAASVRARPLTGAITYREGFNANGIDVNLGSARFVMVQTNTGRLFLVRPSGQTLAIDLGGRRVRSGDGVFLRNHTVYVVQNFPNKVTKVRLADDFLSGRVVRRTTDPDFDVPTSIDGIGDALYLVNARFTTPPGPDTEYWITRIPRP